MAPARRDLECSQSRHPFNVTAGKWLTSHFCGWHGPLVDEPLCLFLALSEQRVPVQGVHVLRCECPGVGMCVCACAQACAEVCMNVPTCAHIPRCECPGMYMCTMCMSTQTPFTPWQPACACGSQAPGVAAERPEAAHILLPAGLGQAPSRLSGLSVPCPLPSPQAGTLTCELSSCPYCTSALEDPELEFSDSDSGDSDSNGVYEFTRDVRHGDRRDPMQPPPAADTPDSGGTRRRAQRRAVAGEQGGLGRVWASFSGKLCRIVDSKYFNRGIMVAILTNTLSMGIEYHEQVGGPVHPPEVKWA